MATTRRWSRWLIGLGAHLACAVVAVAVVPFLIPVDHCRPLLEQVLSLEASRQGSITGLRLELWPRVHVRAARVHAKNLEGFPSGDAVTMHSVDLGIGPRLLRRRQLEITNVAIDGVRITLLTDVQGRTNLDLPPARCRTGAGAQGEARPLLALNRIDAVTVSHADLAASTRGRQTAPAFQVTGLGATIRPIDPGVSDWTKAVEIAANLRGTEVVTPLLTVPVQILLRRAPAPPRAGEGERSPLGLDTLRATGSVSIAGANPALTAFALSIPELDVNRLQRLMNPGQCEVASKPI